jgi:hypothetical protein
MDDLMYGGANCGRDIDRAEYAKILQYIKLRVTETYDYPPEVIQICGITIATLGNFSASVGKPKSKKTFNVSAIVASALSGKEVLRYMVMLPPNRNKVLYVDTEQSKCHCHKVMNRILKLANLPTDQEQDRLIFLMLREYTPKQRRQIINITLAENKDIGLVVIDGLRDLMYDLNSPGESVDLINDLMRWSSMHDLHIHTILHLNKTDEQIRGHVGTELANKAETILQVTKSAYDPDVSEVKAIHVRDKDFPPFAFRINNESLPELIGHYSFSAKEQKSDKAMLTDETHAHVLEKVFAKGPIASFKVLIETLQIAYTEVGFKRGRNSCIELNKYLMGRGIIEKGIDGYSYNPDALIID